MAYLVGKNNTTASNFKTTFKASAGQTSKSFLVDLNPSLLSVYRNGVLLYPSDYSVSGKTITFNAALELDDEITVESVSSASIDEVFTTKIEELERSGIPEWDSGTEYQANKSFVQYNGKVYKCIQTGTNKQPDTQPSYWRDEYGVSPARVISSFDGTGVADGSLVHFSGRDSIGDGGGGALRFDAGSVAAANGVTIYDVNGGRLVREGWTVFGVNVKWAGAKGDGITDDTAAVQAAIDASTGYFGGTFCEVLFPNGNYVIGNLRLRTGTRLRGTSKYGCWLTAKTGATAMIETEYNSGIGLNFRNQCSIEGFTIRYDGLVSDTNSAAIRLWNSYGNAIRDCYIYADNQRTSAAWGIWLGQGVYTTLIENAECKRVRIYSATADRPTTLTFVNWDGALMDIDNAGAITLLQPVVQSRVGEDYGTYRISVKNCFSFNATGGDYEDDDPSHFIYYFDNVTNHLVSMGNWTTGFAGGYAAYGPTGIAPACKVLLQDDKNAGFEYREGNWTPSLSWSSPGTSVITMPTVGGSYIKNGNIVTCTFYVDNADFVNGTAAGYLVLSGLPFTAVAGIDSWGGVPTLQIGYPTNMQSIQVLAGTKTAAFKKSDGSGGNVVVADVSGGGKYLRGTFTYKCVN